MKSNNKSDRSSAIATLADQTGGTWKHVEACAAATLQKCEEMRSALAEAKLIPSDCAFVAFGSLARDEFTEGSDIDWTLLVDGTADPQHLRSTQDIARILEQQGAKEPGPTAVFGGLSFSHDLIHKIGGDADSNKNTTRRVLLMLESRAIGGSADVRDRVLRHIFRRYLEEDPTRRERNASVPRFLLNDIVRFWRTMAVDFAAKRRSRAGKGWAIRNLKLRMSRKLIFAAGLVMCLSCEVRPSEALKTVGPDSELSKLRRALEGDLLRFANETPLEILTSFAIDLGAKDRATAIVDLYDAFLGILRNSHKREELEKLDAEQAMANATFEEARTVGRGFHDELIKLFFSTNEDLIRATQKYGVF